MFVTSNMSRVPVDSLTRSTDKMLTLQDELIEITARLLKESDDLHNAQQPPNVTHFGVDTFVLVQQRTTPETHMHTLWRGPMRVVSHCGRERCRKGSRSGRLSYRGARLEAS